MTGQQPVLIVIDDEPGILEVVGRFAARAGFQVIACGGGREGIARVQSTHADLVMVDLRMPDVGGLEVLRAIRESNPNCQAVLMTGYASVETAVEAIKLGAMDYLSKPLDFGRLQQMLAGVRDEIERGVLPAFVVAAREAGAIVGSVCTGAMLLAAAGLVEGRPATTHHAAIEDLRAAGARIVEGARFVDDGDLVTAGGVTSGLDLALHVVEKVAGASIAEQVAREIEYERVR